MALALRLKLAAPELKYRPLDLGLCFLDVWWLLGLAGLVVWGGITAQEVGEWYI